MISLQLVCFGATHYFIVQSQFNKRSSTLSTASTKLVPWLVLLVREATSNCHYHYLDNQWQLSFEDAACGWVDLSMVNWVECVEHGKTLMKTPPPSGVQHTSALNEHLVWSELSPWHTCQFLVCHNIASVIHYQSKCSWWTKLEDMSVYFFHYHVIFVHLVVHHLDLSRSPLLHKVCNLHLDDSPSKSHDNRMHWTRCNLLEWKGIYNNCEPFTDQLQPIYFTCNGLQTKPICFKYKLSKVWRNYIMQSNESLGVLRLIFPSARAGRRPVIGWKH